VTGPIDTTRVGRIGMLHRPPPQRLSTVDDERERVRVDAAGPARSTRPDPAWPAPSLETGQTRPHSPAITKAVGTALPARLLGGGSDEGRSSPSTAGGGNARAATGDETAGESCRRRSARGQLAPFARPDGGDPDPSRGVGASRWAARGRARKGAHPFGEVNRIHSRPRVGQRSPHGSIRIAGSSTYLGPGVPRAAPALSARLLARRW